MKIIKQKFKAEDLQIGDILDIGGGYFSIILSKNKTETHGDYDFKMFLCLKYKYEFGLWTTNYFIKTDRVIRIV